MANPEASVENRWRDLTKTIPGEVADTWWSKIQEKYGEPQRKYHNLEHVHRLLELVDAYKAKMTNPDALCFALFFQHLEYDPQSANNEEPNIACFQEFADAAGIEKDSEVHSKVVQLLSLTSSHMTDEHKTQGIFGEEDKHFFLDLDMSYLGSPPTEYTKCAQQIREEYSFLPDKTYKMLRSKILKSFLQIPNIFATRQFRDAYEVQARSNVEQEIADLSS